MARKLNLWPTTGWKSFFSSYSSINGPCVRARQTFSGGYRQLPFNQQGERVEADLVIGPSFSTEFRGESNRSRQKSP